MAKTAVHVFLGAYGSGKTEVAINFACREQRSGKNVSLVDLDIVNPYFRSRDSAALLESLGLRVISSAVGLEQADLPALSPAILGALQTPDLTLVFDVGGDPAGARALGRFHRLLDPLSPEIWMVVNPYRPETSTADEIVSLAGALRESCRQRITGLVANPNLGPETTIATIGEGFLPVREASDALGVPITMVAVREDLAADAAGHGLLPLLPLHRYMLLPWEHMGSEKEGVANEEACHRRRALQRVRALPQFLSTRIAPPGESPEQTGIQAG